MSCNTELTVYVPKGYDHVPRTVRCGDTSPTGDPYLCEECSVIHAGRDWRREAEENGERYDPLD